MSSFNRQPHSLRFWFLAFPDIKKPIGGIKQIHRISEVISSLGYSSIIVQKDSHFRPDWFTSDVITISQADFFENTLLDISRDLIVLPETFIGALTSIYPSIPKIIFNQNAGYTFGMQNIQFPLPSDIYDLYHHSSVKQVWSVSEYDRAFLSKVMQLPASKVYRIYNSVESTHDLISAKKRLIAYMPRKNKVHSDVVINLLSKQGFLKGWKIVPISGFSHDQVQKLFSVSQFFLSFGHPEGFGLPIAEALSTGCSLVGYDGLGGKELFELAERFGCAFSVDYGDFYGFVDGISTLLRICDLNPAEYTHQSSEMAKYVCSVYSKDSMIRSVSTALQSIDLTV